MVKVFIIDKEPVVSKGLEAICKEEADDIDFIGYSMDCGETVGLIGINRPDVILFDVMQFGMEGLMLLRELCDKGLQCIVWSRLEVPWFAKTAMEMGAKGFIAKNDFTDTILEAIHTVGDKEVYFKPAAFKTGRTGLSKLSFRETQIIVSIGEGKNTKSIARKLHISEKTVESHRINIIAKLGLKNGSELTLVAVTLLHLGTDSILELNSVAV